MPFTKPFKRLGPFVKVKEFERSHGLNDFKGPSETDPNLFKRKPSDETYDLLGHSAATLRRDAVKAFGEFNSLESFRILKHHAENDPRFEVRGTAINGLANLVLKDPRNAKFIARTARYLMTFLNIEKEKSVLVRIDALRAINALIEKVPDLASEFLFKFSQLIRIENNVYMKNLLLRSIALSKDDAKLRYVMEHLYDKDAFVRYGAILAVLDIKGRVFEDIELLYYGKPKVFKESKRAKKLAIKAACEYYVKLRTPKAKQQVLEFFDKIFNQKNISFELYEFALDMFIGFDFNIKRRNRYMSYLRYERIRNYKDTLSEFADPNYLQRLEKRYNELEQSRVQEKAQRKEDKRFKLIKDYLENSRKNIKDETLEQRNKRMIRELKDIFEFFDVIDYHWLLKQGFSLKQLLEATDYDIVGLKDDGVSLKEFIDVGVPPVELAEYFAKEDFLKLGFGEQELRELGFGLTF